MIWILYQVLFAIGFTLMLPRFLFRMARRGGYARDFAQRFGFYRPEVRASLAKGGSVWIHAVSVGEMFVALRLMRDWRVREPSVRFVLSTTTSTGYAIAQKEVKEPDAFIYFPLDMPFVMRRILKLMKPRALVLVELELWPNLVRQATRRAIPVVLINGRISDRSFRGYQKVRMFTSRILPLLKLICAQSKADADRLIALGAPADRVHVMGSAKYDVAQPDPDGETKAYQALEAAGLVENVRLLLGGSTWPGEESILLDGFKDLRAKHPSLRLVLAPRHVERSEAVANEILSKGFTLVRRTEGKRDGPQADVFLLDTTGELKNFYAMAEVIFVGKSLTEHGGQNIIEPALFGKPVVVGPNMENFRVIVADFLKVGGLVQVNDGKSLIAAIDDLLTNPDKAGKLGQAGARLLREQSGAMQRTLDRVLAVVR